MPNLQITALILWLAPWIGIMTAYFLSAQAGEIPSCFPHLEGCTSVSSVGRHPPGFLIFKATMWPVAAFTMVYWKLCYDWLAAMGDTARRQNSAMLWLGLLSSLALILYTTFLGSEGDVYRLLRRYGTAFYYGFLYLAQVLLAARINALALQGTLSVRIARLKVAMCAVILTGGLILAATDRMFENDKEIQNISEWLVASMMTFYPFLTWLLWRESGFEARFTVRH